MAILWDSYYTWMTCKIELSKFSQVKCGRAGIWRKTYDIKSMIFFPPTKNALIQGQSLMHTLYWKQEEKQCQTIDAAPRRELFYISKETRTFQIWLNKCKVL